MVAIIDSNSEPDGISHPVPGNDDAGRALSYYCDVVSRAVVDGIRRSQGETGVDLGAMAEQVEEASLAPAAH